MGRACSICTNAEHDAIDHDLAAGVMVSVISRRYGVGQESVHRHRQNHLSPAWAAEAAVKEAGLVTRIETIIGRAEQMFTAAAADGKSSQALDVLKEIRLQLELWGRANGELDTRPQVTINLMASEEYIAVRTAIFAALMAYPAARQAVAANLLQLEEHNP